MILSSEVARLFGLTAAPEVGVQGLEFQSLREAKRGFGGVEYGVEVSWPHACDVS